MDTNVKWRHVLWIVAFLMCFKHLDIMINIGLGAVAIGLAVLAWDWISLDGIRRWIDQRTE
jgi:hypothetical protein